MLDVLHLLFIKIKFTLFFLKSKFFGFISRNKYEKIKHFCLFIGYPRTGHSLIASLLDAHPNIIMGMEWNVLHYLEHGYKRNQILWAIERNSRKYKEKCNNTWTNYNYRVEGLLQGYSNNILIIGDKMAGLTTSGLMRNPLILNLLENVIQSKIKLIHVIRNPYDTITTMTIRVFEKHNQGEVITYLHLLPMINKFFQYATVINKLKASDNFNIIDVYHEKMIADPIIELKRLINFFEINADEEYYQACAKIIYTEVHKSRYNIFWTDELISLVDAEIQKFEFLRHYRYDN